MLLLIFLIHKFPCQVSMDIRDAPGKHHETPSWPRLRLLSPGRGPALAPPSTASPSARAAGRRDADQKKIGRAQASSPHRKFFCSHGMSQAAAHWSRRSPARVAQCRTSCRFDAGRGTLPSDIGAAPSPARRASVLRQKRIESTSVCFFLKNSFESNAHPQWSDSGLKIAERLYRRLVP